MTLERHGRLGNWMYSYASLLGIAKANGYTPYLLDSHPLNTFFKISYTSKKPVDCKSVLYDEKPCAYNKQLFQLPFGNITIDGYIQSWKYFRLIEQEVRQEFILNEALKNYVIMEFHNLVGIYLQQNRLIISIHVRRGDVLKPEARRLGFCHAPKLYFDRAMKHMLSKFPHSAFLVFSDDMAWCQENIKTIKINNSSVPIVFSRSNSMGVDMGMLSLCNHSIISVGTFGWWGAWLANGHVVYYDGFPLPGTKVFYETVKEDYFPENWIAISGSEKNVSFFPTVYLCIISLFKYSYSSI